MLLILYLQEFNLSILAECLYLGALRTLQTYNRENEIPSTENQSVDEMLDSLYKASQLTMMMHINQIINMLPVPHQILDFQDHSENNSKYLEKIEDFFLEKTSVELVFQLASCLLEYLVSLATFPWKPKVPLESQSDVCRFCTFCLEVSY